MVDSLRTWLIEKIKGSGTAIDTSTDPPPFGNIQIHIINTNRLCRDYLRGTETELAWGEFFHDAQRRQKIRWKSCDPKERLSRSQKSSNWQIQGNLLRSSTIIENDVNKKKRKGFNISRPIPNQFFDTTGSEDDARTKKAKKIMRKKPEETKSHSKRFQPIQDH